MDLINVNGFTLRGLEKFNVILGKNGCGKSHLLKQVERGVAALPQFGRPLYISPERGGLLVYEPGIEHSIAANPAWINDTRRQNQADVFRRQSAALFRMLELLELRSIERDHSKPGYQTRSFDSTVDLLNTLLDRVQLQRNETTGFRIVDKGTSNAVTANELSSGESELISLGIELLYFVKGCAKDKDNVLLLDEADVHLHPDLQERFAQFAVNALSRERVIAIFATHSTALLAGLARAHDTRVAFMRRGGVDLTFRAVDDVDKSVLPIFGAHPLSNVFNEAPILLVEGEDDDRIWQQAVRSSRGRIRLFPCAVDGIAQLPVYENHASAIIQSVYDRAIGYSLRDRDEQPAEIDNVGSIVRLRLACRTAENLFLSNEVLQLAGSDWQDFVPRLTEWVGRNPTHQYHAKVKNFIDQGMNRKEHDLKDIRNILAGLITNKPWEVLVGQATAALTNASDSGPESLRDYLGANVCANLLKIN